MKNVIQFLNDKVKTLNSNALGGLLSVLDEKSK